MGIAPRTRYAVGMRGRRRGRKPGLNDDELDAIDSAIAQLSGPSRTGGKFSNNEQHNMAQRLRRRRQRIIQAEMDRPKKSFRWTPDADLEEYY